MRKGILFVAAAVSGLSLVSQTLAQTPSSTSLCNLPEYKGTAIYNKYCSGSAAPGAASGGGGGITPQQQQMLNATGSMLQMMIQQQQQQQQEDEARERAEAAARAAREADVKKRQDARLEEARQRLQGAIGNKDTLSFKGLDSGSELTLKLDNEMTESDARDAPGSLTPLDQGNHDATNCRPQSSMAFCGGKTGQARNACVANYMNGYNSGMIRANNTLAEAYRLGQEAKRQSKENMAPVPRRASDPCGVFWIEAFFNGVYDVQWRARKEFVKNEKEKKQTRN